MKPHKKCVEESKKRCWCIHDFISSLPTKNELDKILKGFGVSDVLGQRYKLVEALNERING